MKKYVLFIILVGCFSLFGQEWTEPIKISNGNTPDLEVDRNTGLLHVLSMDGGLKYTRLDATGNQILQEAVPGATSESGGYRFGASVSTDNTGNVYVAYRYHKGSSVYDGYLKKRTSTGWGASKRIFDNIERGYSFRVDVDDQNRVHMARGSTGDNLYGPVKYYRVENDNITQSGPQWGGYDYSSRRYRPDDRVEIDSGPNNNVHVIMGCPAPSGPLPYYRSTDGGTNFSYVGDMHHSSAGGRIGSPDLFVDATGTVHICYGSASDASKSYNNTLRYARIENGTKVRDLVITGSTELGAWHQDLGLGSVAASDDGQIVVVAYLDPFNNDAEGTLHARYSQDGGVTWSSAIQLSSHSGGYEARCKQYVRAKGNTFYLVYGTPSGVYLRILDFGGAATGQANPGGPYESVEGSPIVFDASESTDENGIVFYEWDWNNDSVYDTTSASATITYTFKDDYSGLIGLRTTNGIGQQFTGTTQCTVENIAPVVYAGADTSVDGNFAVTFSATVSDVGVLDTHTFVWDFGDAGTDTGRVVTHSYVSDNLYTVTVTCTDDDGGEHSDSRLVNVTGLGIKPVWSDEILIDDRGHTPDLEIDRSTSNLHVVCVNNGLYYSLLDSNGVEIRQDMLYHTTSENLGITGGYRFGPSVSVDQSGNPHVAYTIYKGNSLYDGYYRFFSGSSWSSKMNLYSNLERAYVIYCDIDNANRVHISRGTKHIDGSGRVKYYRLEGGSVAKQVDGFVPYRYNDRHDVACGTGNQVHMVLGSPDNPSGAVSYFRSTNNGNDWNLVGDIRHIDAVNYNGCPDIFVDQSNGVHMCYGVSQDASKGGTHSVRYTRYQNGVKQIDVPVTDTGELSDWNLNFGIGSVAASDNGNTIVVAYQLTDGGPLYARYSRDGGTTWSEREKMADVGGSSEARNRHIIRAAYNSFYLVYSNETESKTYLRILRMPQTSAETYEVSGIVTYYSNGAPINNVEIQVPEDTGLNSPTQSSGLFAVQGLRGNGNYTLKPYKETGTNIGISDIIAYDAALAAQGAVGVLLIQGDQFTAADVDNNSELTTFDAALIAQYAVGMPILPVSKVTSWAFSPPQLNVTNISGNQSGVLFRGIIKGNVKGGWLPSESSYKKMVEKEYDYFDKIVIQDDQLILPVYLQNEHDIISFDIDVEYDKDALNFQYVTKTSIVKEFESFVNETDGRCRVAMYSVDPVSSSGTLCNLVFKVKDKDDIGTIKLNRFIVNADVKMIGQVHISGNENELPEQFALGQNYPNPFNPSTKIDYQIPTESMVSIKIYNFLGQEVKTLVNTSHQPGYYNAQWNGTNDQGNAVAGGVYFYTIQAEGFSATKKLIKLM